MAILVWKWIATLPHLSGSAIANRKLLLTLPAFTPSAIHAWIVAPKRNGQKPSNNYVRDRVSVCAMFLTWLVRNDLADPDLPEQVDFTYFRREYPRVYGHKQSPNPARFLTYEDAYHRLIPACQDGTWIGSRDHLAIRLGLLGLRRTEAVSLTWGDYDERTGTIARPGKRNRIRQVHPGPTLTDLLARWKRQYEHQLQRPVRPFDPILCGNQRGYFQGKDRKPDPAVHWGHPLGFDAFYDIVKRRAELAGLGHVAPHDLRRTAASILHNATTADGGHRYDLLDIQKVLDHADPATTQRSYISQLDNSVRIRAGATLD